MTDTVFRFLHPWVLLFLIVPVCLAAWEVWKRWSRTPSVLYSDLSIARGLPRSMRQRAAMLLPFTRMLVLILGIIALARPQYGIVEHHVSSYGIDIGLVIDVSNSMQMTDFRPNRLEAAKSSAINFVRNRKTDRISVIVFGNYAGVLLPPTLDMQTAELFISAIYNGIIDNTATAIGDALGLAARKLEDSEAASRVIILLTDGENNAGRLQPMQAAEIARALGIRVYTIGVGRAYSSSRPMGPFGALGMRQAADFDASLLEEMADLTGGRYFHASDERKLDDVYAEIDALEKREIETDETVDFSDKFLFFWGPALFLLGIEILLRAFWLGRLP